MQCMTKPVAAQVLDDPESAPHRSPLNDSTNAIEGLTSASLFHGLLKSRAGGMA
jgi:hypothetical protein